MKLENSKGNKVDEVYLPCPQEYFGSGRIVSKITLEDIIKVTKFCHENGIRVNVAFNSACEGLEEYRVEFVSRLIKVIKDLHQNYGVDGIIIANPLLIRTIKKTLPTVEVITSAFSDIDCLQRAVFFEKLGADTLTLNSLNRDLETLKEIKETVSARLRLMVNEGCLWKCPFRTFHNNFISHASRGLPDIDFCSEACIKLRKTYPFLVLTTDWILPQWLKYYKDVTKNFKIVGRTMPNEWIMTRVKDYLNESFSGNLLNLMESGLPQFLQRYNYYVDVSHFDENFFKKVTSCNKNCFKCNYCINLAEKIIISK